MAYLWLTPKSTHIPLPTLQRYGPGGSQLGEAARTQSSQTSRGEPSDKGVTATGWLSPSRDRPRGAPSSSSHPGKDRSTHPWHFPETRDSSPTSSSWHCARSVLALHFVSGLSGPSSLPTLRASTTSSCLACYCHRARDILLLPRACV